MTIDQALIEAAKYIDEDLLPTKKTVYNWINAGAIRKADPDKRTNEDRKSGRKNDYPPSLPCEIAAVAYLQKIEKKKITDIADYRAKAEAMRTNQNYLIDENAALGASWLFWFIKFSNGYHYRKPVRIIFKKLIATDTGRIEITETIEEAPEDGISLRSGRFTGEPIMGDFF